MQKCRCGVSNWRQIREGLGVSRRNFANALAIARSTLEQIEADPHHCPNRSTVRALRIHLFHPLAQLRLHEAGVLLPWPEDDQLNLLPPEVEAAISRMRV